MSWPNWGSPIGTWFVKGLATLGLRENPLLNSGHIIGSSWTPYTVDPARETRDSSETSFLVEVVADTTKTKGSLTVYPYTLANRILFSTGKTATGVLVSGVNESLTGPRFVVSAKKEVILAAGALQSPQLLMVSGVGPKSTLSSFNIALVADRPGVGQNLQEHALVGMSFPVNVVTGSRLQTDPSFLATAVKDYYQNQSGPLTFAGGPLAFEKLPAATTPIKGLPTDWPELEYLVAEGSFLPDPKDGFHYGSMVAALAAPLSRGSVTIASPNMIVQPTFDLGLLARQEDADVLLIGFKRLRQLLGAMSAVVPGPDILPGPNVTTDEQIMGYIRASAGPVWHAAGTCAMGKSTDSNAVVDTQGRVYGVSGLRVVDASAFPVLPPGHPQSLVYALAEKIAADILSGLEDGQRNPGGPEARGGRPPGGPGEGRPPGPPPPPPRGGHGGHGGHGGRGGGTGG